LDSRTEFELRDINVGCLTKKSFFPQPLLVGLGAKLAIGDGTKPDLS
jgi:hypothetical protein